MKKTESRVLLSKSGAAPIKIESASTPLVATEPGEDDIRAYAYHLFEQSNGAPGHDLDNWFEATACLKAAIPVDHARSRLHRHIGLPISHAISAALTPALTSQA